MRVEKDFEELLGLFNKHKVKYCIAGAFAVGFYGYPRYTKDMDIFVEPSLNNGQRIMEALGGFGFSSLKLKSEDFIDKNKIIQLGHEPVRIDLITSLSGCSFPEAWKHRQKGLYGKQKVFFVDLPQLLKNKKLLHRPMDLVDIENLKRRLKILKRRKK